MRFITWMMVFALAVLVGALVFSACSDDDDDSGDDDQDSEGATCYWECEEVESGAVTPACFATVASQDACNEKALEMCEGENEDDDGDKKLIRTYTDFNCQSCGDESCWPDWYDG